MDKKNQVVFLAAATEDGTPLVALGVSKAAWEYMKDGKTHTFDLTRAGIPVQIVLFGGDTPESILADLKQSAPQWGVTLRDRSEENFSIPEKPLH